MLFSECLGMCEAVMVKDDILKDLQNSGGLSAYPGGEDSDEEDLDALGDSYDIQMGKVSIFAQRYICVTCECIDLTVFYKCADMEFNHILQQTSTAQRLKKMDQERKKASKIKHIKWENNPSHISLEEQQELFKSKDLKKDKQNDKRRSLFSEQLEKCPDLPQNPFVDYAKFDGNVSITIAIEFMIQIDNFCLIHFYFFHIQSQIGVPVRRYRIFMCMLPKDQRNYPLQVVVFANAKVREFIGLICYKYFSEHPDQPIQLVFFLPVKYILCHIMEYTTNRFNFAEKISVNMDCTSPKMMAKSTGISPA